MYFKLIHVFGSKQWILVEAQCRFDRCAAFQAIKRSGKFTRCHYRNLLEIMLFELFLPPLISPKANAFDRLFYNIFNSYFVNPRCTWLIAAVQLFLHNLIVRKDYWHLPFEICVHPQRSFRLVILELLHFVTSFFHRSGDHVFMSYVEFDLNFMETTKDP